MLIGKTMKPWVGVLRHRCHFSSYYDVLGVEAGATPEEIKAKYYELAKKYHPDSSEHTSDYAEQRFLKIKEAYQTLSNEEKRKNYDNKFSEHAFHKDGRRYGETDDSSRSHRGYSNPRSYGASTNYASSQRQFGVGELVSFLAYGAGIYLLICMWDSWKEGHRKFDQERKQREIYTSPAISARRKELYAQQMREKKIYGQVVTIKARTLEKESTRARKKRECGLMSIEGIEKDGCEEDPDGTEVIKPEYI